MSGETDVGMVMKMMVGSVTVWEIGAMTEWSYRLKGMDVSRLCDSQMIDTITYEDIQGIRYSHTILTGVINLRKRVEV